MPAQVYGDGAELRHKGRQLQGPVEAAAAESVEQHERRAIAGLVVGQIHCVK